MIAKKLIQRSKWMARDMAFCLELSSLPKEGSGCRNLIYMLVRFCVLT
ncbi:MAG: hypothetical protein ACI9FU_001081 [Granulosicoccus sp.]|jgi:hypothetical protein